MGGATENEQPIYFLQSAQLDLAQRRGLLQPSEALFDQPSAAQTDDIAGLPRGSAVQVAGAVSVVAGDVWSDIELPHGARIRYPSQCRKLCPALTCTCNAACAALLFLLKH